MTKTDARVILTGLIHTGLVVERMTPLARTEVRAALDKVLELVEATETKPIQLGLLDAAE
jgi:hypothetical protein